MLAAAGMLAGVYPAWRAASLPIAGTLRREAVA
jgi:ABC-type lipoprotein release transport system permease subunit